MSAGKCWHCDGAHDTSDCARKRTVDADLSIEFMRGHAAGLAHAVKRLREMAVKANCLATREDLTLAADTLESEGKGEP